MKFFDPHHRWGNRANPWRANIAQCISEFIARYHLNMPLPSRQPHAPPAAMGGG
jgi:hypothetical protein